MGDQMSHYNVNGGVPKTLIQHLLRWVVSSEQFDDEVGAVLTTSWTPRSLPSWSRRGRTISGAMPVGGSDDGGEEGIAPGREVVDGVRVGDRLQPVDESCGGDLVEVRLSQVVPDRA
jgi:hypothetical protein